MSYNPNEPREPKGSPTGGQWTAGDAGDAIKNAASDEIKPKDIFPETVFNEFAYHGSSEKKSQSFGDGRSSVITEFNTEGHWAQKVAGAYFSPTFEGAADYANYKGDKVYKVALNITKLADRSVLDSYPIRMNGVELRNALIKAGYDGVYDKGMKEIVVFRPDQIKIVSVMNRNSDK